MLESDNPPTIDAKVCNDYHPNVGLLETINVTEPQPETLNLIVKPSEIDAETFLIVMKRMTYPIMAYNVDDLSDRIPALEVGGFVFEYSKWKIIPT